MRPCFECEAPTDHDHHVVPRSLGGTKTVPLCHACHAKAHGLKGTTWASHAGLTAAAMARMKDAGLYTGGLVPYGYRVGEDGRLVAEPSERAVLEAARELHHRGLSLRAIARSLAKLGHVPRGGTAWSAATVSRLVRSKDGVSGGNAPTWTPTTQVCLAF
jgi:hypothetical protein